ncbi:MAG: dihydropteroate synthase [Mariprofundaceae bacterium]|nr:dihydropteroate synthase [Mariprofundaceae bacterium]
MIGKTQAGSRWLRQSGEPVWMMGVLNCTPDSFSDGGQFIDVNKAIQQGIHMHQLGANVIDVGGESTRPGASIVPIQEELRRVIPVVESLSKAGCHVSIDTRKSEVMQAAVKAGACMINDVTALSFDEYSLQVAASSGVDVCLMHMQGTPENMQESPFYQDVMQDVLNFFEARIEACLQAGMQQSSLILDPGIGFGKRLQDNLYLIMHLDVLKDYFNLPILLGVSRKSLIASLTDAPINDRELETAVLDALGIYLGADGVRVHDIAYQQRANRVAAALSDLRSRENSLG